MQRLPAITHDRFSLIRFRSPLLTESRLLSLPVGTEMFHFPTFPPPTLCVQVRVTGLASSRVSPFGNPRITVWLSTPRGLSQIPTSFFGSWYQGIHRAPLKTWPQRCSRPLCSSQHTGGTPPHAPANPTPPKGPKAVRTTGEAQLKKQSLRPSLQDPTTCQAPPTHQRHVPGPHPQKRGTENLYLQAPPDARCQLIDDPPMSNPHDTLGREEATWTPHASPPAPKDQQNPRCQCSLERR